MRWLHIGALIITILIITTIITLAIFAPDRVNNSANPEAVIERVEAAADRFSNYSITSVSVVNEITIVTMQFSGQESAIPKEAITWHQAAESIADQLYYEIVKNRTVQVELYHNDEFRAVAIAGLAA